MSCHKDGYDLPAIVLVRLAGAIRDYRTNAATVASDSDMQQIVDATIVGLMNQIIATLISDAEADLFREAATPLTSDGKFTLNDEQHERVHELLGSER